MSDKRLNPKTADNKTENSNFCFWCCTPFELGTGACTRGAGTRFCSRACRKDFERSSKHSLYTLPLFTTPPSTVLVPVSATDSHRFRK